MKKAYGILALILALFIFTTIVDLLVMYLEFKAKI